MLWKEIRKKYSIQIIIPVLNELKNLQQLLPRLHNTTKNWPIQISVVDAQYDSEVEELCNTFSSVQYLVSPKMGRANQMNFAAQKSQADVLYFVHSDTRPPLSFYTDIQDAFDKGYVHGSYRFKFDTHKRMLKINEWFTRFKPLTLCGGDQTIFVPRMIFEDSGAYPEHYMIMEEYEWMKQMRKVGASFCKMTNEVLVSDRKYHDNSWLRVNLANFLVFQLYFKGWNQEKLIKLYKSWIKHPTL